VCSPRAAVSSASRSTWRGSAATRPPISGSSDERDWARRSLLEARPALLEEGGECLLRVGRLARPGHHVEGMVVRGALVQSDLGVEGLLAEPLLGAAAAGRATQQADGGLVELLRGDDVVDEPPVERGAGVDRVPGQAELQRPLLG